MSNQLSSHSISYRPEIDGLRALAILPVVLFHAFPNLLPGGFTGVDIFFVISGYLITSILLKDIQAGTYSIKTFYARRIRRIFPALIVVLIASLVFGWVMLTPEEYQRLGKHTAGGVGFIANFMFLKEVGYFDAAADTKPLLHLWSLGIEEQFYIVWPILLAFILKKSWSLWWVIIVLGCTSFLLNISRIAIDPSTVFYSPLTRSWELALGAFVAYQTFHPIALLKNWIERFGSALSVLGLLLIFIGFIFINEKVAFPGWWALLPALGAAIVITSRSTGFINTKILSNRLLVWVGLISFPLYLWHWPLLSFARIIYSETPAIEVRFALVILSFILAWATFLWVEKPIRHSKPSKKIIFSLVIGLLIVGITGHLINKSKGVPSRQFGLLNADPGSLAMGADRSRLLRECGISEENKKIFQICWTDPKGQPRLAVIGDSKAEAIFYGLARESSGDASWMMLGNMTPVASDLTRFDAKNTLRTNLAIEALLKNKDIEAVLIGVALRSIFAVQETYSHETVASSPHYQNSLLGLSKTFNQLEKSGKKVIFFIDHPGFPDPKSCISGGMTNNNFLNQFLNRKVNPRCSMTYEQYRFDSQRYFEFVADLKKLHPKLYVYDPTPLVCDIPNNRCEITKDGKFLYSYGDHLSDYANSMIAKDLLPKITQLLKNN
jgi:peptidoglycan/LPS O-acetylase OafA/YrhL